ncbi:hypothetical protein OCF63_12245 [Bacillus wiedmannii]|uniref:hypothetical protein n=1 Tax=Bacillus wiedmannii TaxID=1890302 RepID=UPI0021D1A8AF|nr:hypothetical protein [Bacillus wiedmannii]MCU5498766.1 hypothetical protein [Bacillus wiedmannii]
MKIEVGDFVNTTYSRSVEVLEITPDVCNKSEYRVWFINDFGDRTNTLIENCTLVKKGEKKMKTYTGFEAIKKMKTGIIDDGNSIYRINERKNNIEWKLKFSDEWSDIPVEIGYFFQTEFTDYVELLKYKVGDEVWVKAKIQDVRTDQNYAYPYVIEELSGYYKEEELKGIDE